MSTFLIPFVFLSGIIGLIWAYYNYRRLSEVVITSSGHEGEEQLIQSGELFDPVEIGAIIEEGAIEFIVSEYKICSIFIVIGAAIIFVCVDGMQDYYTTAAFVVGAVTSMFCGAFAMKIATYSNYRTTLEAKRSLGPPSRRPSGRAA